MKDYYTVKDIMNITGYKKSRAYEILIDLRVMFKKEYPDSISFAGKIPCWYAEKILKNKKDS